MMVDLPSRGYRGRIYLGSFLRYRPLWLKYEGDEKLIDFQVQCTLTKNDIAFEKLRYDKQDLLFVTQAGETIPYWIEKADANEITVWLKFSEIRKGTEVFWLYYGNRNFSGVSDGKATFLFYDDFEDGDISDWTIVSGTWSADNGYLERTGTSGSFDKIYKEVSNPITNFAIDLKTLQGAIKDEFDLFIAYNVDETVKFTVFNENGGEHDLKDADDGTLDSRTNVDDANTWWDISFRKHENNFKVYKDGALWLSGSPTTDRSAETITQVRIMSRNTVSGEPTNKFDLIRVRKFTEPEPYIDK